MSDILFSSTTKLNHVGKIAFHAPEEKRAGEKGEDRHRDGDPKNSWIERTLAEHAPAKAFDKSDHRIEREQRLPLWRLDHAGGINEPAPPHPDLEEPRQRVTRVAIPHA